MVLGIIGRSQALADAIGRIVGFGELDKTRFREALLEQELGGLRCIGQIRLEGSLATYVSQLIFQWIDLPLGGRWRGFYAENFGFLFDNRSAYYLVFASFFPTLLAFILLLCFNYYGLEQLYCLSTCIYSILHLV